MDDCNFQLPAIPVLHVPTYVPEDESKYPQNQQQQTGVKSIDTKIVKTVQLPKMCPSCSVIFLQYLKPLQQYLNQMVNLTTGLSTGVDLDVLTELKKNLMDSVPSSTSPTSATTKSDNLTDSRVTASASTNDENELVDSTNSRSQQSNDGHNRSQELVVRETGLSESTENYSKADERQHHHHQQEDARARTFEGGRRQEGSHDTMSQGCDGNGDQGYYDSNVYNSRAREPGSSKEPSRHVSHRSQQEEQFKEHERDESHHQAHPRGGNNDGDGGGGNYGGGGGQVNSKLNFNGKARNENNSSHWASQVEPSYSHGRVGHGNQEAHGDAGHESKYQLYQQQHQYQGHGVQGQSVYHQSFDHSGQQGHSGHQVGTWKIEHKEHVEGPPLIEVSIHNSPYAFVTIVYDDMSAINAIILANSVTLSSKKQVRENNRLINLPFVVLISGPINSNLLDYLPNVFDEVLFTTHDIKLSLLSDASFGVTQLKLQLWKCLSHYEKCFFIESTSLVVGDVDDVFLQFNELSACVDWLFPDSFCCSVFVFEPNESTYTDLTKFATELVRSSDDPELTSVDEMTILNQFFSSKWNKMSFIYNFSQNSLIYTQQPAFTKFGGAVKIVNFSFTPIGAPMNSEFTPTTQPWHVHFNLNQSTMSGDVHPSGPVNNYVRFYLSLFIKRVWPLLRHPLTPKLLARGKQDWSIYEIVSLLRSPSSFEPSIGTTYSPIILRRRDPFVHRSDTSSLGSISIAGSVIESETASETESVSTLVNYDEDEPDEQLQQLQLEQSTRDKELESKDSCEKDQEAQQQQENPEPVLTSEQQEVLRRAKLVEDKRNEMRAWESGQVDWMGVHQSDRIISMLRSRIEEE